MKVSEATRAALKGEASARHSAAVFLIIFTLVGADIRALKTEEERQKATAMWLAWGIPFLLLAFFIITPEQEAIEKRREQTAARVPSGRAYREVSTLRPPRYF